MMSRLAPFAEHSRFLVTAFLLASCHSTLHAGRSTDAGAGGLGGVSFGGTLGSGRLTLSSGSSQ